MKDPHSAQSDENSWLAAGMQVRASLP